MKTVVTKAELAVLVETWLLKEKFKSTAMVFQKEAREHLDKVTSETKANAKSLQVILEDFLQLKKREKQGLLGTRNSCIDSEAWKGTRKRDHIMENLTKLVEDYSKWTAINKQRTKKRPRPRLEPALKEVELSADNKRKRKYLRRRSNEVNKEQIMTERKEEPRVSALSCTIETLNSLMEDRCFASKLAAKINEARLVEPEFEDEPDFVSSVAEQLIDEEIKKNFL